MQRDGACTSLWQIAVPEYISLANEAEGLKADVILVGGGITGMTTALQLQKAGLQCIVLEKDTLCFGTTGGTTAHLNNFFDNPYHTIINDFGEPAAQRLAQLANQALELFQYNVESYSIDCDYAVKNGYVYAQEDKQVPALQHIYEGAMKAGVEVVYADHIPVPVPFEKAIVFPQQAQIHPTRYVYGLAKAFTTGGGTILEHCLVMGVEKKGDVLEVETNRGRLTSRYLIYATHIPPGIDLLHFRCAPYRSYAMAVRLKDDTYPDGLAYDLYDPYHYMRTQEVDGKRYLIAGGEDHKTGHETNTEGCFNRLEAYVRRYFPVAEVAFRWSSQYYEPADGLAYIGHLPENPDHVLVATGFGGNGMTYSHIAAIVLTELIIKGEGVNTGLFKPGRIKPVAGFANFVKENADVITEFVGKRLSKEKLDELADLAPGEGKTAKYEGKTLAIYKDEQGGLHALNPVCTHAKCIVAWNSAEKSWDCPCHGARYGVDGQVLTGPARKGLEKVEIVGL
jgi:glycine/D-amino acid oxidase-like deaminating enzyme/nitrite reductase/ring-hydroxylating ferredoxin subunit